MRALANEILRVLESERAYPPLSAESLVKVLHAIGFGPERLEESVVQGGIEELLAAGKVERVWRRGVAHYRLIETSRLAAADETIPA